MKTYLFLSALILSANLMAQKEGEIQYTTKINLHAEIPDDENSEMLKSMIPEFQEMKNVLLFNETSSLYTIKEEDVDEELSEDDGDVNIKIEMDASEEIIYTDVKNGLVVSQRDLMGKTFLIKDTIQQSDWIVKDDSKLIAGINCQKAIMYTDTDTITAWFTTDIPVSTGPAGFGGLPGLIVYAEMMGGSYTIIATKIIGRELKKNEIKAPTKGKEVTEKKFREIEEKKMKERQEQYGGGSEGGGNVIMITN